MSEEKEDLFEDEMWEDFTDLCKLYEEKLGPDQFGFEFIRMCTQLLCICSDDAIQAMSVAMSAIIAGSRIYRESQENEENTEET